ncbi:hypothetical protein PoB_005787300 [Plakobranchus ocellatus]|uniref:Uncharacterized protein n=1 Tax=Plakobranchus ocellatus TaxID=259542 RepID=A0AAV4CIG4_9GAST|nr:hypothetical protein PoB_005787300 [Plakobranchus ocellatus]
MGRICVTIFISNDGAPSQLWSAQACRITGLCRAGHWNGIYEIIKTLSKLNQLYGQKRTLPKFMCVILTPLSLDLRRRYENVFHIILNLFKSSATLPDFTMLRLALLSLHFMTQTFVKAVKLDLCPYLAKFVSRDAN